MRSSSTANIFFSGYTVLPRSGSRTCSGSVYRGFGTLKLIHNPLEARAIAEDHALHGPVILFDHRAQSRLRRQPHRSGNGFLEPLPGLPEGHEAQQDRHDGALRASCPGHGAGFGGQVGGRIGADILPMQTKDEAKWPS